MRDPATFTLRSFWVLSLAGAIQILAASALLLALVAIGQRRLVDFIVILPIVAMLLVTAAGALILASQIWVELGRSLAAPRLPGPVQAVMKRLNGMIFGSPAQPEP